MLRTCCRNTVVALRKHALQPCTLIRRIESPPSALSTPEVEGISDGDEDFYQAMVLIQSIIKGRAAQMHVLIRYNFEIETMKI